MSWQWGELKTGWTAKLKRVAISDIKSSCRSAVVYTRDQCCLHLSFNILIDDLYNGAEYTLSKSADDTELGGMVDTLRELWCHLEGPQQGGEIDWLKFNNGEVQSPDLRNNNPKHQYMLDVQLENSLAEKNLGILVDNK